MKQPGRRRATAPRPNARTSGAEQIRRGGGLRRLPELLARMLEPAARRRGLAEAKLLTEWSTVVGPALAGRCHPVRLSHTADRSGGVLLLHVAGSAALELQHSAPQILERINGFFGYAAVSRLRLLQAPLPKPLTRPEPPAARAVSDADDSAIARAVREIRDPVLRTALHGLGRTLRARSPVTGPGAAR
jgi:hypothetical protein